MAIMINMPRLGLTMTEGIIAEWKIKEGDRINKGDIIAKIESDKSVVPYESPESGTVLKLLAEELDTVSIYEPIAVIGNDGEPIDDLELTTSGMKDSEEPLSAKAEVPAELTVQEKTSVREPGKIFASPAAKRVAKELDIDISEVPFPTGKARIQKADVLAYAENRTKVKATPLAKKIAAEQGIDLTAVSTDAGRIYSSDIQKKPEILSSSSEDTIIPVTGIRKIIASRMKESLETAAHLTTVIDVDMTEIIKIKEIVKDSIQQRYDVKISYNDILLKCVASAIEEYPRVNCRFEDTGITQYGKIDLGMAVAVEEGLVVPVIRNANHLSLGQIASEAKRLAGKARDPGLAPDDMSGGTFTVSNLGMYGITSFTSIINQPESAILSVGAVIKKPVVIDDELAIRPMTTLTLSYDHRAIDGAMSAIFLKKLKDIIESPYKLMI